MTLVEEAEEFAAFRGSSRFERVHRNVRARVFPVRIGIAEDEATGSAATKLVALIGRPIDIRQGRGSRILARPRDHGLVEIGGRSVEDDVRDYVLP